MTKLVLSAAAILSTVFVVSIASANSPALTAERGFASVDSNKDGTVSYSEFKQSGLSTEPEMVFRQLDRDGDGRVSQLEFEQPGSGPLELNGS